MNSELLDKVYLLKESMINSDEYKELKKAELMMENDEEVQLLAYKKDMLIVEMEDKLKIYKKDHPEILKINKDIATIIEKMSQIESVKKYNEVYKKYSEIIDYINKEIFSI